MQERGPGPAFYGGTPPSRDHSTLRFYWDAIVKYRRLAFLTCFLVLALVLIDTFTATPLYMATATVEIDAEPAKVLPYQEIYQVTLDPRSMESDLRTQYSILQTREMARGVIKRLNLTSARLQKLREKSGVISDTVRRTIRAVGNLIDRSTEGPPANDQSDPTKDPADRLLSDLDIEPVVESRLMQINYSSPSPKFAALVANAWADEYIEQNFQGKLKTTEMATKFLADQLKELRVKVEQSERDLNDYARAKGIFTTEGSQNEVSQKLTELNTEITKAQASLIAEEAHFKEAKAAGPNRVPTNLQSSVTEEIQRRLAALREDYARLSSKFGPEWPDVVQTQQQIAQMEEELRHERQRALEEAEGRYRTSLQQYNQLSGLLNRQRQLAYQLNSDLVQFNTLKRDADTNRELYEGLLARMKQAGVEAGFRSNNIRVVDRATQPEDTWWPRKTLNLALALFGGLTLGLGLAVTLHLLDTRVHTPEDVIALDLPSLGIVPKSKELKDGTRQVGLALPGQLQLEGQPTSAQDPADSALTRSAALDSPIWEAYRRLRTCLLLSNADQPPAQVLVTSAIPGEGKTTTAAYTGVVFAETGAPTLLIDLDLRRGGLSKLFELKNDLGMSVYLSGHTDLEREIRPTGVPNLSILPAGLRPPNPAALLSSKRLPIALERLSKQFRFIVIDTGPLLCYTDALILSTVVDGVVLVARADQTAINSLKLVAQQLTGVGANIFGVVVNGLDVNEYGYGAYGAYYPYQDQWTPPSRTRFFSSWPEAARVVWSTSGRLVNTARDGWKKMCAPNGSNGTDIGVQKRAGSHRPKPGDQEKRPPDSWSDRG
ncbi:MAG: GumC family protein [Acidobacteriota bacterium]